MKNETVVVIDFGAKYSQAIVKSIREANVYAVLVPFDTVEKEIMEYNPKAVVLSGGPVSVYSPLAPRIDQRIFNIGVPILGVCYGMQLLAYQMGGRVERAAKPAYGQSYLETIHPSPLFEGIKKGMEVWMDHGDNVLAIPVGFKNLARTDNTAIAAIGDENRRLYGVQFHPADELVTIWDQFIKNFLYKIAGCRGDWTIEGFVNNMVEKIKRTVGARSAICGLSGGVDSTVAARLMHKAIGNNLFCVFVDNGLLREGEAEEVAREFSHEFGDNFIKADAGARFLSKLKGLTDPEEKRRQIGHEFIRIFEEEAAKLPEIDFLVQGTLYSDIIESGMGGADKIKSHHNVGGLPERMQLQLIEPLKSLFKDEVRQVGLYLGIAESLIWRQPFPGPGLAVRIIGEVNKETLEIVRKADLIVREELAKANLTDSIWQAFAVLATTLKSVGMKDGERTYQSPIIIRAVTSEDAMTAEWAKIPTEVLAVMAKRIVTEIESVNRVLYDITSKPPGTIEWE